MECGDAAINRIRGPHAERVKGSCEENREDASALDFYRAIGLAVSVMGNSPDYCQYPIACVTLWLEPAIRHHQIHFFFDSGGIPVGYLTWAWLATDTEQRLLHDPTVLLHISEWNEGDNLWILDFVLVSGDLRARLREAVSLFGGNERAKSLRRHADGTVRKTSIWRLAAFRNTSRPTR